MPLIADSALSLRAQSRSHQRRAAPKIGAFQRRAGELFRPGDHGHGAPDGHLRSHALHLRRVAEAIVKNILYEHGAAPAAEARRHQQRRRVRGKAGIRPGDHRSGRIRPAAAGQADRIALRGNGAAHAPQGVQHRDKLTRLRAGEADLASGADGAAEICSRGDPVRRDAQCRPLPGRKAIDADHRRARPADLRAERAQIFLQGFDLRLPGGVIDDAPAPGRTGGDHGVLRGSHAGELQRDLRAVQGVGPAGDGVPLLPDIGAQQSQGEQMQIDGALAQLAAPRQGHLRPAEPGQERSEKDHRRAHPVHQLPGDVASPGGPCVDGEDVLPVLGGTAQIPQDVHGGVHIAQMGTVEQLRLIRTQQRGRDHRQNGVL